MTSASATADYRSDAVTRLRADLALALRAAAFHGLAEGVCNHFSVELPDGSGRFLLNPRGLLWKEVQADDVVMVDVHGEVLAGRHPVEPTAMYIHAAIHRIARKTCVLHTHMPHATALTLIADRALDPTLSQTAMRFRWPPGHRRPLQRCWPWTTPRASASPAPCRAPTWCSSANHGVVVCAATACRLRLR